MNIDLNGNTLTGNVSYTNLTAAGVVTLSTSIPGGKVDGPLTVNTPAADFVVGTGVAVTGLSTITDVASSTFINNGTLDAVLINDTNGTRFVNNNTVGTITLADNVNATLVGNFGTINTGAGSTVNFETGSAAKDVTSTTAAVVKAEESKLQDDVVAAKGLVDALADGENKTALLARLEAVTAPVISNVNYKSTTNVDNDNSSLTATDGDIITLTFTSSQPITKLSSFKINGSNPDTFTNVGNVYTVTHLVDSGDVEGDATLQINVQNAKGVYSKTIEKTTDGSSVTITHRDTTPPIVLAAPTLSIPSGSYNESQTVTIIPPVGATATYYSLDGSEPDATKNPGTSVNVSAVDGQTVTLKAISYNNDQKGEIATCNYTFDLVPPTLTSSSIQSTNVNPELAKTGDSIVLNIDADEEVVISNIQAKIDETASSLFTVNDTGDNDASTWKLVLVVGNGDVPEGTSEFAYKMTDLAGNTTDINFGTVTDGSNVVVDQKSAIITDGELDSGNTYVDVTFSEPVYGGSEAVLSALEPSDFIAEILNVNKSLNEVTAQVNSVTKTDGTALTGGESVVRVHFTLSGTVIQGDKIEIRTAENAIFDHAGNETDSTEKTNASNLAPLVTFEWNESNNTVSFTSKVTLSAYSNTKLQLIGKRGDPEFFLTTPTKIGGDDQVDISITSGWDGQAVFGASANGIYAQATNKDTIQFTANNSCSELGGGCFIKTDFKQDHLYVIIKHLTNPAMLTILDLNIDSSRVDPITIN